jgi:hypothetical protein
LHLKNQPSTNVPASDNISSVYLWVHEIQEQQHSHDEELNDSIGSDESSSTGLSSTDGLDIECIDRNLLEPGRLWTFDNNVAADMEYEDEGGNLESLIPTSRNYNVDFRSQSQYVGSHVILNKHSTLLIRRKDKMKKNTIQKHFISKIVSRLPLDVRGDPEAPMCRSIPLLYPEGSLFPNIFFKACIDGGIVGAMPAAFLTDNASLRRMGMATVHEHMRTRITSTSLLTSHDNVYLLYGLDACLNLGTRGHDTRVLLKRGWDPDFTKGDGIRMKDDGDRTDEVLYTTEQLDNKVMCDKIAYAMIRTLPTFFWTFTLNCESCFGMRVLKQMLDSDMVVDHVDQQMFESGTIFIPVAQWSPLDFEVLKESILASSAVTAMRIYENFWHVF